MSAALVGRVTVGTAIASGVLVALALGTVWEHLDRRAPWGGAFLDVVVGLGIGVAALWSPAPAAQRLLLWSVGASWLLASVVPLPTLHQALLALALGWFPTGMPRDRWRWAVPVVAAPMAVGLGGQVLAGVALLLSGVVGAVGRGGEGARWFPATAGIGLGAGLAGVGVVSAVSPRSLDPTDVLLTWEAALLVTAVAHIVATTAVADSPARRVRDVLTTHRDRSARARRAAVEAVLGHALRDPYLRVTLVDPLTGRVDAAPGSHVVRLDGADVAAVTTTSTLVRDPVVARALDRTLALAARSMHLAAAREQRLEELIQARRRLMVAGDLERERLARRLGTEVLADLAEAGASLDALGRNTELGEIRVARAELQQARDDIAALLRGVPPYELGGGRVVEAIRRLACSTPGTVAVEVDGEVAASPDVEAAVYYVCSEALTNVVKHAHAGRVEIRLTGDGAGLGIEVKDDGGGGADPGGPGLEGLRERVIALDGAWRLESTPAGTLVAAFLPSAQPMRRQGSAM